MFVTLAYRSIRRVAALIGGLALVLGGVQVIIVLVATSQEEAQSFDLITKLAPAYIQRQFGASLPVFLSFGGLVTFGYFHPVVILTIALSAAFFATELAADVESGYVDLLLSRPVSRHWLVTRTALVLMLSPLLLVAIMLLATYAALAMFAPSGAAWPKTSSVLMLAAHLVAMAWCCGALSLAIAASVKRRMTALGPAAILAVSLYLLDLLAGAWPPLAAVAVLSPFHYFQGAAVFAGTADVARDFQVLGTMTLVAGAFAYWRFSARDL